MYYFSIYDEYETVHIPCRIIYGTSLRTCSIANIKILEVAGVALDRLEFLFVGTLRSRFNFSVPDTTTIKKESEKDK